MKFIALIATLMIATAAHADGCSSWFAFPGKGQLAFTAQNISPLPCVAVLTVTHNGQSVTDTVVMTPMGSNTMGVSFKPSSGLYVGTAYSVDGGWYCTGQATLP